MARKAKVSFDSTHGLYHRFIGVDRNGRKPHFWLGADLAQAERRAERLEMLWHYVEADWQQLPNEYTDWLEATVLHKPDRPLWDDVTLAVAKAVAKGEITLSLPRKPSWSPYKFTLRITDMQRRFPVIAFTPEEGDKEYHQTGAELLKMEAQANIHEGQDQLALIAGQTVGPTFHQALDAFVAYLEKLPDKSGWYRTQIKQTKRLKENHPDVLLAQLGLTKIEEMIDFWRHRPVIKEKVIAATTARNQIIQLGIVFKWLDRSDQFHWQKPRGYEDIKQTVKDADQDRRHIETFTREELTILWQYATPLVRLQIALALNCGFKEAEIGSLTLNEIHLNTAYPGIVRIDRPEGLASWIVRYRRKTKVYGEFKLWVWTVAGIEWAKANRKVVVKSPTDFLLVTRSGRPLDARTQGGNKSDKMYSSWRNLYKTVRKDHPGFKYLPFKHLEKTASEWLRAKHGWEIANRFVSHGKPVKQDTQLEVYASKPFGRLFNALDDLADYLRPVFTSMEKPWEAQRVMTSPLTVARVKELREAGKKLKEIAQEVGLHWVTVGKMCGPSSEAP